MGAHTRESIIYAASWVAIAAIMYFIDPFMMHQQWISWVLTLGATAVIIWLGIRERERRGGYIAYWPAWKLLVKSSLFATVASILWTVLMFTVINPDIGEQSYNYAVEKALEEWERQGLSDRDIEVALEFSEPWMKGMTNLPGLLIMQVVVFGFGLLLFMIWALIVRKEGAPNAALDGEF